MPDKEIAKYKEKLDAQNLKTAKDLETLVKQIIKPATKLNLKKTPQKQADSHLRSHFGGQPYFEKGDTWPADEEGNKFEFVFQVFNNGSLALPAEIKLFQFYYDFSETYEPEDSFFIRVFTEAKKENAVIIKKPAKHKTVKYCEIEFEQTKTLPHWEELRSYSKNAYMLSCVLDEEKPWACYKKIAEKLCGKKGMSSRLGGYPAWLQNNENPGKSFSLLFQLDSEEDAGLMWSDTGLIYFFLNPKKRSAQIILQHA